MNRKHKNYKKLVAVWKRLDEVREAQWNLGYEPLEEPYQKGWDAKWVLRKDVSRRDDAEYLEYILERFGVDCWSRNKDFIWWDRCERRYRDINPKIKRIDRKTWESLPPPCKKWFTKYHDRHGHYCPWLKYSEYICIIPKYFLVKKITPCIVTHKKVHDEVLEQEYSELRDLEDRLVNYRSWYNMGHKSAKEYQKTRNRSFRNKEKRAIKKAMRTGDWENMDLPIPKKQVLWDMW